MDPSQQQDRNGYPNYNIPVQSYNPNLQGMKILLSMRINK